MRDLIAATGILVIIAAVSIASYYGGESRGIDIGIIKGKKLCAPQLDCPHQNIVIPTYNSFGLPEFYEYKQGHFNRDRPEHYFTLDEWQDFKKEMYQENTGEPEIAPPEELTKPFGDAV